MKADRSSILLFSEDRALRDRVRGVLEREIDASVDERESESELGELDSIAFAVAVVDVGPDPIERAALLDQLPRDLPVLTLHAGPVPEWVAESRPEAETLERDAPPEHIVHALRLSLLRNISRSQASSSGPRTRRDSSELATRSVLGDLRLEFRTDLATVLRDSEQRVLEHEDAGSSQKTVDSEVVLRHQSVGPTTNVGLSAAPAEDVDQIGKIDLFITEVRRLRKLADTLDLAEFAPLLFALEVSLRDLPTPDGRSRVRDLLRQLRNIAAGRPASAGFNGRRIRVALIGSDSAECQAFGLEDPDRLDVRPFRDLRTFSRQIDIFRPDVVAMRVTEDDSAELIRSLREVRGGTREAIIALTDAGVTFDPIDCLRFPQFAQFETPFAWNDIAGRVFQLKGETAQPARILVVHDDDDAVRQVQHCLDPESFEVRSVASPAEVLTTIGETGPDLIFVGQELDRLSGFDVCREIRAELPLARLPLIVLTDEMDAASRQQAFRVGADDYLELPLVPEEVRRRANILIEHRHLRFASTARDPLTGLDDGCTLIDRLRDSLEEARDAERWTSLLALDIDRFEMIRSFYGQASANTIVRSVADALRKIFDHDDTIFRGTEDEFFVVRKEPLRTEASRAPLFDGIADIGRLTFRSADGRGFYATVTGGHVLIPPGHLHVEDCVRRTMRVLDAAKKTARGKIMTAEIDPSFEG